MTDKTDALVARLRMHARDCVSAADMDTDTVLSAAQIDEMADALNQAAEALAAPAEGVGWVEFLEEWIGDGCLGSFEHREKFRKSARALIDSAGGAKCGTCHETIRADSLTGTTCACATQPAEGDGAVGFVKQADLDALACSKDEETAIGLFARRSAGDSYTQPIFATRPSATAAVPRPSDDELWDQTLRERDDAEKALGDMFQAVTGRPAEWSSAWHYRDAIEEVEDHMCCTLAAAPAAPKGGVDAYTFDVIEEAWGDAVPLTRKYFDVFRARLAELRTHSLANQEQRHDALADGEAASA